MPESDARAVAEALAERIEDLAELLVGEAPTFRTRTAIRFYPRGGLAITVAGRERGLWCSHGEGGVGGDALDLVRHLRRCSTAEALAWARDYLGQPEQPRAPERRPAPAPRPAEPDSTDAARRIWIDAVPAAGTPVETYLASRGLTLTADAPFRFHPACRREKEKLPAMVTLMSDPITAEPCGVHRTYLRPDGGGKIEHGKAKMMLGRAGVIRLVPDDEVTLGLGIAEGIETALAITQLAGWSPIWACGSAGAIAKFPILAGVESLTIFCDLDDQGAGIKAAEACADRWREAGRSVAIAKPPRGTDWHDALAGRAA